MAVVSRADTDLEQAVRMTLQRADMAGMLLGVRHGADRVEYLTAGEDAVGRPMTPESLFPVQSVTKLATALAVLRLVELDKLALDAPLDRYIPEAQAARHDVTIRDLLRHTSGLPNMPADPPAWTLSLDWLQWAKACLSSPLEYDPRSRVAYSGVGYCLLGILIGRQVDHTYPDALRQLVLEPLEIDGFIGEDPDRPVVQVRYDSDEHAGTDLAYANSAFYRSMGFPDGGLVTTAAGALALLDAFLGSPAGFLGERIRTEAIQNQVGDLGGGVSGYLDWESSPWGLGPEIRGSKTPHWTPQQADPGSFGHSGDSGCLVWRDDAADLTWVRFGTREHPWMLDPELPLYAALYGQAPT
jgi:CubicO group peptidase (beta-lactamase class C family)